MKFHVQKIGKFWSARIDINHRILAGERRDGEIVHNAFFDRSFKWHRQGCAEENSVKFSDTVWWGDVEPVSMIESTATLLVLRA